jgi:hypothetical protein
LKLRGVRARVVHHHPGPTPATPHHRCPSIGDAGPSPGRLCSMANFAGPYVGVAVGSAVRLCSIVSRFCSIVSLLKHPQGNTQETPRKTKKPNDGASLTRVGATVNARLGQLFQFCRERRCLRHQRYMERKLTFSLGRGLWATRTGSHARKGQW